MVGRTLRGAWRTKRLICVLACATFAVTALEASAEPGCSRSCCRGKAHPSAQFNDPDRYGPDAGWAWLSPSGDRAAGDRSVPRLRGGGPPSFRRTPHSGPVPSRLATSASQATANREGAARTSRVAHRFAKPCSEDSLRHVAVAGQPNLVVAASRATKDVVADRCSRSGCTLLAFESGLQSIVGDQESTPRGNAAIWGFLTGATAMTCVVFGVAASRYAYRRSTTESTNE